MYNSFYRYDDRMDLSDLADYLAKQDKTVDQWCSED